MGRLKKRERPPSQTPHRRKWPPTFKLGWFRAAKIFLEEAAINNLVVRVPLVRQTVAKPKQRPRDPKRDALSSKRRKRVPLALKRLAKTSSYVSDTKTLKHAVRRSKVANGVKNVVRNGEKLVKRKAPIKKVSSVKRSVGVNRMRSRLTIDFVELSDLVCVMKLPSATWKVTVLMNHDFTTVFKFTDQERSKIVTFSQTNPYYSILIEEVPVVMLGCPRTVASIKDVEILLEIVNRLKLTDCMVATL